MKKVITTIVLALIVKAGFAQQEAMITQYMFNGLYVNPAYAGTHKYWQGTLQHRRQWANFEGAPKTSLLCFDGPVNFNNMGVGFILADDRIGVTHQTDLSGIYSYHLKLGGEAKLSFGLKAGFSNYSSTVSELKVWDTEDIFVDDTRNYWIPKFGFGTYYHIEKFYAGVSFPTLIAYDAKKNFNLDVEKSSFYRRHYYFNTGGIITLNESLSLRPSGLVKYVPNAPLQADINLSLLIKETLWIGASYRTQDAAVAIIEYQVNKNFRLGYSFDFTTSAMRNYSSGSHEIMLGIDLYRKDAVKTKTPRFF